MGFLIIFLRVFSFQGFLPKVFRRNYQKWSGKWVKIRGWLGDWFPRDFWVKICSAVWCTVLVRIYTYSNDVTIDLVNSTDDPLALLNLRGHIYNTPDSLTPHRILMTIKTFNLAENIPIRGRHWAGSPSPEIFRQTQNHIVEP